MASFQFANPSGSAYFVIETITTSSLYPEGTPKYMEGTWNVDDIISYASAFADMTLVSESYALNGSGSISINTINFIYTGSAQTNTDDTIYLDVSTFIDPTPEGFANEISAVYGASSSLPPYDTFLINISPNTIVGSVIDFIYTTENQSFGNTLPYSIDGVDYTFSGGSNYNFGLVTSSFIAGVVVQPGYSTFDFIPNITIPVGAIEFRGTGEYTVIINP